MNSPPSVRWMSFVSREIKNEMSASLKWVFNEECETPRARRAMAKMRASSHERVMDQTEYITWIMTGASSHTHLKEPRLRDLMQTSLMQTSLMRVTGHWPHRVQLMSLWEKSESCVCVRKGRGALQWPTFTRYVVAFEADSYPSMLLLNQTWDFE